MKRIIALTAALLSGTAALASDPAIDPAVSQQITAQLTADGYEVRKVDMEDGMYEAYAMKDGKRYEIYFDKDLNIVKTDMDD